MADLPPRCSELIVPLPGVVNPGPIQCAPAMPGARAMAAKRNMPLFVFIESLLWLEPRDTRRDASSRTDAIAGSVILLVK